MTHEVKYSIIDYRLEETMRARGWYTLGSTKSFNKLTDTLPYLCDIDGVWDVAYDIYEHSDHVRLMRTYQCHAGDLLPCIVEDVLNTATDIVAIY